MLNLDFKEYLCDNCMSLSATKKIYVGKFQITTAYKPATLSEVSKVIESTKRPYEYFEALEFMMGLRNKIQISDGYDTFMLTKNQ